MRREGRSEAHRAGGIVAIRQTRPCVTFPLVNGILPLPAGSGRSFSSACQDSRFVHVLDGSDRFSVDEDERQLVLAAVLALPEFLGLFISCDLRSASHRLSARSRRSAGSGGKRRTSCSRYGTRAEVSARRVRSCLPRMAGLERIDVTNTSMHGPPGWTAAAEVDGDDDDDILRRMKLPQKRRREEADRSVASRLPPVAVSDLGCDALASRVSRLKSNKSRPSRNLSPSFAVSSNISRTVGSLDRSSQQSGAPKLLRNSVNLAGDRAGAVGALSLSPIRHLRVRSTTTTVATREGLGTSSVAQDITCCCYARLNLEARKPVVIGRRRQVGQPLLPKPLSTWLTRLTLGRARSRQSPTSPSSSHSSPNQSSAP